MNKFMKTNKKIEESVIYGYKTIEDSVVSGYKAIENSVVSGYKKIENKFAEAFLRPYGEDIGKEKQYNKLKQNDKGE